MATRILLLGFFIILFISVTVAQEKMTQDVSLAQCRDRYFQISTHANFSGGHFGFEVIDDGVHKLDVDYAAECGYTFNTVNPTGFFILRVSFFACHVENKDDSKFTLRYQVVSLDEGGRRVTYPSQITCALDGDWKPREVLCEENYMEVSVRRNITRVLLRDPQEDLDETLYNFVETAPSKWQLLINGSNGEPYLMSIAEAQSKGYRVASTPQRVVLRAPYNLSLNQMHMVDVIKVEGVSAVVILSNQSWAVVVVETSAACARDPGTFDGSVLEWTVPRVIQPKMEDEVFLLGVDGRRPVDQVAMATAGYRLDVVGPRVKISVPIGADGGFVETRVIHNQYNSRYAIPLVLQRLWAGDEFERTRHRIRRTLHTSYVPGVPFTIDQTDPEDGAFSVYLGNFPRDVDLVAVQLNGHHFTALEANQNGHPILKVPHTNGTHAYVIRVPFEDSIVSQVYQGEGVLQYTLDTIFTLNIMPQQDPFYHAALVTARLQKSFPPKVTSVCNERSITFNVEWGKLGYLWEVGIGQQPLTPKLAMERGYIMQNDSRNLTLEVPLFTIGYIYEDVSLKQFFGSFEIVSRDTKTLKIAKSTAERCLFETSELLVCAPGGLVTVVIRTSMASPPVEPSLTSLLDETCRPAETDDTRALFTFTVDTCGTRVKTDANYVSYENEVVSHRELMAAKQSIITRDSDLRLTIRCHYPVTGTARLHTDWRLPPDDPLLQGVGSITEVGSGHARKKNQHRDIKSIHNGIFRGHQSQDLKALNAEEQRGSSLPYVPVVGVVAAVLGTLLAALLKMHLSHTLQ